MQLADFIVAKEESAFQSGAGEAAVASGAGRRRPLTL
jgi:hypothetical protein